MIKIKKITYFGLFFVTCSLLAQVQFKGVVKDSDGTALEMANFIAINQQTKKIDSYGFSDAFGNFKLNLKKNTTYIVKTSYVGIKTKETLLKVKDKSITQNLVMQVDTSLDEVEIIAKMPVTISGDTISYNADSFNNGTEKKLGDVLENLPGVEVSDGEIKVEGKMVKKVTVEGKDFFDGDTKLATKNIPANAVDKVQVLKNHSEVRQMSRVTDNEDNIVINIKLKEGKKTFWFGDVTAGSGIASEEARYVIHPKLFYYSPKTSVNIITDLNNVGKVSFSRRDYYKFSGGFRGLGGKGTNFNIASSDIGFLSMKNNKAKELKNRFGAFNFSYSPNQKLDISGFGIYSGSKTVMENNAVRNYILPNTNIADYNPNNSHSRKVTKQEQTQSNTHQNSNLGLAKLSAVYTPNTNNQLDYDVFAKVSKQDQHRFFKSIRNYYNALTEEVPIEEIISQNPFSVNQNLNYYYTLNDNHIFAFVVQHLWQDEDPFYNAELSKLSFAEQLGITTPQSLYYVSQEKRIKTHKLDSKLDYFYVINDKSNLNITLGATLSSQKFNSKVFETLQNGTMNTLQNTSSKNDVQFSFNDYFAGLHYKFITGVFTFDQGVTLHSYTTQNRQLGTVVSDKFIKLLPDASVKIALKKSENIRLKYSQEVNFTDVNKVAQGYVLNNYNSLYSGNRELESGLSHNFNLSYYSFSMFNYTNVSAFVNYSRRINPVKRATSFNGVDQSSTSINSLFPDEIVSAYTSWSKSFRNFKLRLGANASYSKLNNLVFSRLDNTNQNRESNSFNQGYTIKLSTNFRSAPNFDVGYKLNINRYNQGGSVNTFTTHSPFVNVETFITDELIFTSKYTYNNYRNQDIVLNEYSFWDADITYQKTDSKWEYMLEATNLLNTKALNQNGFGAIFNITSSYSIQPRIVTFSIKYNL